MGYDHATGFGILRAESPLDVEPMKFGSAGTEIRLGILKGIEIKGISVRTGDRNRFLLMKPKKTI